MVETFTLPEYHSWPFFYTIQKNVDTRERQLKMWSDLICAYCKHNQVYSMGLNELYDSGLAKNEVIGRQLSVEGLHKVCEWMQANKFGEYTAESKERIFVYWRSI